MAVILNNVLLHLSNKNIQEVRAIADNVVRNGKYFCPGIFGPY